MGWVKYTLHSCLLTILVGARLESSVEWSMPHMYEEICGHLIFSSLLLLYMAQIKSAAGTIMSTCLLFNTYFKNLVLISSSVVFCSIFLGIDQEAQP